MEWRDVARGREIARVIGCGGAVVRCGAARWQPIQAGVSASSRFGSGEMSQKTSRVEHGWTLVCGICLVVDVSVFEESRNPNHSRVEALRGVCSLTESPTARMEHD